MGYILTDKPIFDFLFFFGARLEEVLCASNQGVNQRKQETRPYSGYMTLGINIGKCIGVLGLMFSNDGRPQKDSEIR